MVLKASRLLITLTWLKHAASFEDFGTKFVVAKTYVQTIILDLIELIGPKIAKDYIKWTHFINWDYNRENRNHFFNHDLNI